MSEILFRNPDSGENMIVRTPRHFSEKMFLEKVIMENKELKTFLKKNPDAVYDVIPKHPFVVVFKDDTAYFRQSIQDSAIKIMAAYLVDKFTRHYLCEITRSYEATPVYHTAENDSIEVDEMLRDDFGSDDPEYWHRVPDVAKKIELSDHSDTWEEELEYQVDQLRSNPIPYTF